MEWLVMYDISDSKRLRQVERAIKSYGYRAQKSVFECQLTQAHQAELTHKLTQIIDPQTDSIRLYPLLNGSRQKQQTLGTAIHLDFTDSMIV